MALDPSPENREFFRDLLDNPGAISNVSLPTAQSGRGTPRGPGRLPLGGGILRRAPGRRARREPALDGAAPGSQEAPMTRVVGGIACLCSPACSRSSSPATRGTSTRRSTTATRGRVVSARGVSWNAATAIPFELVRKGSRRRRRPRVPGARGARDRALGPDGGDPGRVPRTRSRRDRAPARQEQRSERAPSVRRGEPARSDDPRRPAGRRDVAARDARSSARYASSASRFGSTPPTMRRRRTWS